MNKYNKIIKRSLIILFAIIIIVFSIFNFILSIEPYDGGFEADLDYIILLMCGLSILIYGILNIYSLKKNFDLKIAYYSCFGVISVLISFYFLGCFFKALAKNKPFIDNQIYLYTGLLGLIMIIYLIFRYKKDFYK